MNSLRKYLYRRPISSVLLLIVVEILITQIKFGSDSSDLFLTLLKEALLAAIAFFFVYLVNGKGEVVFSSKGFKYALKKGLSIFGIALLTGALSLIALLGRPLANNAVLIFLECIVFAILIGLFEEGLFRGLFLNALLTKYGNTYRGILKAMIISSLLFGFLHITPSIVIDLSHPETFTLVTIGQIIGKTIQTGIIGFILAAIYLKNHNLWSVALLHGFNDFLMFLPGFLFNSMQLGNYVETGSGSGIAAILIYVFISVVSIPLVVIGYRISKTLSIPEPGFFRICWFPLEVED